MVSSHDSTLATINQLEALAVQAHRAGREQELLGLWNRILGLDPRHARTLAALGQWHFRRGAFADALSAFKVAAESNPADPRAWINLALTHQQMKDDGAEEAALKQALKADPSDLLALLLKGGLQERRGNRHEAARAFGAAAAVAPPLDRLSPELRPSLMHALTYKEDYDRQCAAFLDQHLSAAFDECRGERLDRFRDALDIMVGRKRRYESLPLAYFYPGLPAIEFFDKDLFPWLSAFESATATIRDEFLAVLERDDGFEPYISYPEGLPLNQWVELNNSPRWSAFHFFKNGERLESNAARCPRTMELLASAPQPKQAGRTPAAMFSLLKPKTRIPPHTGVSNVRLVTHVPLIVPESCGFRCGNRTRGWTPGEAFVFDDTIEHEAWNDSDKLRVVLIFDIWHPMLSEAERRMVSSLAEGLNRFTGEFGGFEL